MSDEALELLVLAYRELNPIRARDGAPPGVSHEWFDSLLNRIDDYVMQETGHGAWLHPLLFQKEPKA